MTRPYHLIILTILMALFSPCAVLAAEEAPPPAGQQEAKALKEMVESLSSELPDEDKAHFMTIYGNYNLIKTVEIVRGDIALAVKACGEANPELKDEIATKFTTWAGAVDPVISEAEGHLENMIEVQEYLKAQQIKDLFVQVDETREAVQKQIEKKPVTSKAGCEVMRDKMDNTRENMVQLLRSTLISLPQLRFQGAQEVSAAVKAESVTPPEMPEMPHREDDDLPAPTSPEEEDDKSEEAKIPETESKAEEL
jgi:hypothetical protein